MEMKMTDLEKREAFEDWFACNSIHDHVYVRGERTDEKGNYYSEHAYLAWSAWQQAQKVAVPEGFVLVPKTNSDKGIESMAMRYRHDFHFLDANYQEGIKSQMRQLYEEAVGLGFYSHKAQESDND